jgi:hypothetical protein
VKENTLNYYIHRTLDGETEYDIARVLYKMYSDRYKCISTKNKIWYEYRNGKWHEVEEGISLSAKLSTTLNQKYVDREHELINKVCTLQDEEERVKTQQLVAKMANISNKLRKTAWKRNIMTEASAQFYDKSFMNKLDNNPNLLCCKNGIIDFDKGGIFRKGKPDDYVSLCTNINYVKFNPINPDHVEIKNEIEKNIDSFLYSGIEWRPQTYLNISKEESEAIIKMLETLEDDDDVQNTFVNCNIHIN